MIRTMNGRMCLRRIGAMSLAKMLGALYALLGLIIGALISLVSIVGSALFRSASGDSSALFGVLFGAGAIIILPIVYGCIGFIGGLIVAGLYNLLAGAVGGIEIEWTPPKA